MTKMYTYLGRPAMWDRDRKCIELRDVFLRTEFGDYVRVPWPVVLQEPSTGSLLVYNAFIGNVFVAAEWTATDNTVTTRYRTLTQLEADFLAHRT